MVHNGIILNVRLVITFTIAGILLRVCSLNLLRTAGKYVTSLADALCGGCSTKYNVYNDRSSLLYLVSLSELSTVVSKTSAFTL